MFWFVLIALMLILRGMLAPRSISWCYVAGGVAALALQLLPRILLEFFTWASLILLAIKFRRHYIEFCTAAPIPASVAAQFKKNGTLPASVTPIAVSVDLWNAIVSWLGYNPREHKLPGLWRSPAGTQLTRTIFTVCTVVLLAVLVPNLVLDSFNRGQLAQLNAPVLKVFFAHCAPALVLVFALVASLFPILGKAGGLRRSATLANYFADLQQDIDNSPNTIERDSLIVGSVLADSSPVLLPLKVAGSHIWIAGTTGCGKTAKLMCLLEQFIHRGYSVVCIDLKADSFELLHTLEAVAVNLKTPIDTWHFTDRHGWPTQLCSPFAQSFWKTLGPSERTNVHLASMGLGFSRDHGAAWFSDASYDVLDFVNRKYPNVGSYAELREKIAYEVAHARPHELSKEVKKDGEHVSLIVRRLAHVEMLNPSALHSPSAVSAGLDFAQLFMKQGVAYWGLNSLVAPITSPEISRVVLGSVLAAATSTQNKKRNVVLVIDEFQQMVAPGVLQLALRQARSLGITVILSNQTVDDLKTPKNNFVPTVEGNTATQMWLSGSGRDAVDQIQRLGGKYIDHLRSQSFSSDGTSSVSWQEVLVDRFDATTIAKASSGRDTFIMRINSNEGYAQYNGIPFIARSEYHINYAEYQRRSAAAWPALSTKSVVVGQIPAASPPVANTTPAPNPVPQPTPNFGSLPVAGTRSVIGNGTIGQTPTASPPAAATTPTPTPVSSPPPQHNSQPVAGTRNIIGSGKVGRRRP
ncbi:MAG: DUF853 family protein [Pirellulaceae bacterium]|nr:DUF853 family protein [Pirellulaceae bacterium]